MYVHNIVWNIQWISRSDRISHDQFFGKKLPINSLFDNQCEISIFDAELSLARRET